MILKANKGMWYTQADKDVKFRLFLKIVPVFKGKEDMWVEVTDEDRAEYLKSKK